MLYRRFSLGVLRCKQGVLAHSHANVSKGREKGRLPDLMSSLICTTWVCNCIYLLPIMCNFRELPRTCSTFAWTCRSNGSDWGVLLSLYLGLFWLHISRNGQHKLGENVIVWAIFENAFYGNVFVHFHHNGPKNYYQKVPLLCITMTSSNGSIFRVIGFLCGEFTGHLAEDPSHISVSYVVANNMWPCPPYRDRAVQSMVLANSLVRLARSHCNFTASVKPDIHLQCQ